MLKEGDIVKHADSPCEVLAVFPKLDLVFIQNKRTLFCDYVHPSDVEFVRSQGKVKRRS